MWGVHPTVPSGCFWGVPLHPTVRGCFLGVCPTPAVQVDVSGGVPTPHCSKWMFLGCPLHCSKWLFLGVPLRPCIVPSSYFWMGSLFVTLFEMRSRASPINTGVFKVAIVWYPVSVKRPWTLTVGLEDRSVYTYVWGLCSPVPTEGRHQVFISCKMKCEG